MSRKWSASMLEAVISVIAAIIIALGGAWGWERRRARKLEEAQIERLKAMAKAQVEAQQRREDAVKNMPPIPDERPARFDDFERGG